MCVCVFLGSLCIKFVFERCFWELKMFIGSLVVLQAWLHSYLYFSLLEKLFLSNLDTSSTPRYLSSSYAVFYRNLDTFSVARWIDRESSWILDSFSIHWGWLDSISTPLDWLRSSYKHCFSHALHLSFILSSIASCFITFMHFYGFFVPSWLSLIIFIFLGWSVF